jgi:hypothetical protein
MQQSIVMSRCWSTTESPFLGQNTNLSKNDPEIAAIRREGWADVPLIFEQVKCAALDSRLGFEIATKCFQLAGYNTHVDRLNVALI